MSTSNQNSHSQRPTSASIRARMSDVREEIAEDVSEIRESTKSLTDWRKYVIAHPLLISAGALALGYVLVPRKSHQLKPDSAELVRAFKKEKLVLGHPAKGFGRGSMLGSLVGLAVSTATRAVVANLLTNSIAQTKTEEQIQPHQLQHGADDAQ